MILHAASLCGSSLRAPAGSMSLVHLEALHQELAHRVHLQSAQSLRMHDLQPMPLNVSPFCQSGPSEHYLQALQLAQV